MNVIAFAIGIVFGLTVQTLPHDMLETVVEVLWILMAVSWISAGAFEAETVGRKRAAMMAECLSIAAVMSFVVYSYL